MCGEGWSAGVEVLVVWSFSFSLFCLSFLRLLLGASFTSSSLVGSMHFRSEWPSIINLLLQEYRITEMDMKLIYSEQHSDATWPEIQVWDEIQ